jgi:histidinol phosphatase-like PHP family hydrolase
VMEMRRLRKNFLSQIAMEQILARTQDPSIVSRAVFRGDFQMHSTWSDGGETIETMAEACISLGHSCMGVTDHSYGLPVARGMSMTDVAGQQREIDVLNERLAGRFRVFKGIEANILADGNLDLQPDERARFEFVVASPHSMLRQTHDQTARMLGAVRQPGVAILGHPRGRMYGSRAGVVADWPRIFAEAARRRVAIEIDGNWHRQDIDFELAAEALDAGCLFALDSDAHSIGELRFTDYSIAHARLAGVPAERVMNTWSDGDLAAWMQERRESR